MQTYLSEAHTFQSQNTCSFSQGKGSRKSILFLIGVAIFIFLFFTNHSLALANQQFVHTPSIILTAEEQAWLAKHPVMRVGHSSRFEPLFVKEPTGSITGILPDLYQLVASRLGVTFEFIDDDWPKIHRRTRSSEIDFVGLMSGPIAKKMGLLTVKPIYNHLVTVFAHKNRDFKILADQDLNGLRVSYYKDIVFLNKYLENRSDQIELIKTASPLEALEMVLKGTADVMIGFNINSYLLTKYNIREIEPIYVMKGLQVNAAVAVRPDAPILASILRKAISSISPEERNNVLVKWSWMPELVSKEIIFSKEEQAWLKAHPVIRVGSDSDWAPMEFLADDGSYRGFSIDILNKIAPHLEVRFEFVRESWQELITRAKRGELDLFSNVAQTPARDDYLLFTEPYVKMAAGIFAKEGVAYISNLKSLIDKKIAVVESYAIHDYLVAEYPDLELLLVKNPEEGIRAVQDDNAFAYIDNVITTGYLISKKGYLQINMVGEVPFEYAQRMGVRKDWPQLRNILQKAIDTIPEAERNALYNQWVPLIHEKPADYTLLWTTTLVVLLVAGSIVTVIFIGNRRLAAEIVQRRQAQTELQTTLSELEQLNKALDKRVLERTQELHDTNIAMQKSEAKMRAIFDQTFQLMGLLSLDGTLLEVNRTALDLAGVEESAVLGKPFWETAWWTHSAKEQEKVRIAIKKAVSGEFVNFETTHQSPQGTTRIIDFFLKPIFDASGKVIYLNPEARDITERKQAEEAIHHSEERYRKLFADAPNCIMTISGSDFTIQDFNQKALEMFRCEAKDLNGKQHHALSPPRQSDGKDSIQKGLELFPIVAKQQGPLTFDWLHQRFDGEIFDSEVSISTLEHEPELTFQAIIRDISERKRLDQEIRLLNHWIEHSVDFFFWVEEDSRILYVNQAVCNSLGYSLEEMRTMKVGDFDLEITQEAWPGFTKKLREQGSLLFESRLRKKDGEIFPVEITANILEFEGTGHYFAYGRDISASIKAETDRKTLEKQLTQAQKMEAIGTLAGGIAHDFNNILSAIFGYAELAKEDFDNAERLFSDLDEILSGASRAKDLVLQILTFSRKSEQEMQPLKIQLVVKEALKLLRSSIPSTIEIQQDINQDCEVVIADPTQIHQIVMNLCTNAYHAMRQAGGVLNVSLKPVEMTEGALEHQLNLEPGSYLELTISDTGCGISKTNQERIFEPYFTTKAKGEGTGLGLAVVHGIVKNIRGEITVSSEPGKGTTFRIFFPVIKSSTTPVKEKETAPIPTGNERILLVDDDEAIVKVHAKILKRLGYTITALTSSTVAFDILQKSPNDFDLVITDMTMPGMTGADLARRIFTIRPNIPIILCTGFSELIDAEKAKEIGIRNFVVKPVVKSDLAKTIRKALSATS